MLIWTVLSEEEGLTVLDVLRNRVPAAPGGYLRQLVRTGKIERAGIALTLQDIVREGDRLNLPESRRLSQLLETGPDQKITVLFENPDILAVYKPAGLAVHRGVGHEEDNLVRRVDALMQLRKAPFRTAPVHRLDVETSGPVLFGKGRQGAARLGKLFMAGSVEKTYLALVRGVPGGRGEFTSPVPAHGKLKDARTEYQTLASGGGHSLIELFPHSGRTHQIRRHLAEAGYPVAGDRRYGGPAVPKLERLFLHCLRLRLTDPDRKEPVTIEAPLARELSRVLETLGLCVPTEQAASRPKKQVQKPPHAG